MEKCKKYTSVDGAAMTYRTRPAGDCANCAYFSSKNCGVHIRSCIQPIETLS